MKKEFTGSFDENGKKLYVGDKVEAWNGVKGKIGKYTDEWSFDEPRVRYKINWSPDGWINDHLTEGHKQERVQKITKK